MADKEVTAEKGLVPRALPGRVILKFPEAQTEIKDGKGTTLVHLITGSSATKEPKDIAEVISIGVPTDRAEEAFVEACKEGDYVIAEAIYGSEFWVTDSDDNQTEYRIFRMFEITGLAPADYKP